MQQSPTLGEATAHGMRNQRLLSSGLHWIVTPLPGGDTQLALEAEP